MNVGRQRWLPMHHICRVFRHRDTDRNHIDNEVGPLSKSIESTCTHYYDNAVLYTDVYYGLPYLHRNW